MPEPDEQDPNFGTDADRRLFNSHLEEREEVAPDQRDAIILELRLEAEIAKLKRELEPFLENLQPPEHLPVEPPGDDAAPPEGPKDLIDELIGEEKGPEHKWGGRDADREHLEHQILELENLKEELKWWRGFRFPSKTEQTYDPSKRVLNALKAKQQDLMERREFEEWIEAKGTLERIEALQKLIGGWMQGDKEE